jgi:hypothetical protein
MYMLIDALERASVRIPTLAGTISMSGDSGTVIEISPASVEIGCASDRTGNSFRQSDGWIERANVRGKRLTRK